MVEKSFVIRSTKFRDSFRTASQNLQIRPGCRPDVSMICNESGMNEGASRPGRVSS